MSNDEAELSLVVRYVLRKCIGKGRIPCSVRLWSKDRPLIVRILRYLMEHGETFTWGALRRWALDEAGSSIDFADELGAIGDDVLAGHYDEHGSMRPGPDVIERWRADAQADAATPAKISR